ncbi:MAG: hypothetical protein IIV02_06035 [Peptococcaceae bacterium]|nr:hypothetical protein [Peptococcaceae bacterium]
MGEAKKTKLKKLEVNSVDLVPAGANPDAHINLFKSKEERPAWDRFVGMVKKTFGMDESDIEAVIKEHYNPVNKQRIDNEIWDYTSALRESFDSIMKDSELDSDGRCEMLQKSMDEFTTAMQEVIPLWATGQESLQKSLDDETIELYKQMEIEALEERLAVLKADGDASDDDELEDEELEDNYEEPEEEPENEEEVEDMKINKALLTPEEQVALDALIKKAVVDETTEEGTVAKAHPENEALMNEVAELKKALAMKDMETVAKEYAILGKDTVELAKSLYAMKQAGPGVYDEFVGALNIAKAERENSGMFTEIGKSRTETAGGAVSKIEAKAAEIMKADPALSRVEAINKAWEQNPELVREYDSEVM